MGIELLSHQQKAVSDLAAKNYIALLLGEVGCGKTAIAIEALKRARTRYAVIFTLKSVVSQFSAEIGRFGGDRASWQVVNHEKLLDDAFFRLLLHKPPEAIIVDECEKFKNPTGRMGRRFRRLKASVKICMSATPMPNALHEAWNYISWMSPGILGKSFYEFRNSWCVVNPYVPQQILGYRNEIMLRRLIDRFIVRVEYEDNLPSGHRSVRMVELPAEERRRYLETERQSAVSLAAGGKLSIPNMLSQIIRLTQLIDDPELFGHGAGEKESVLARLVSSGPPTIIFSESATWLERAQKKYGGALIVGRLNAGMRQEELQRFKSGKTRLLWSSSAGGSGLNIVEATRVIHYGLPLTNAKLRQRFGRIRRIGQTEETEEVVLLAPGTVNERIWKIIERKREMEMKFAKKDYKEMLLL